jgi:hypothetical protein
MDPLLCYAGYVPMRPVVHNASVAEQLRYSSASYCPRCAEDMTYDAADRFMRDCIGGRYSAQRFLLLHYTLQGSRPRVQQEYHSRMFRP